MYVFSIFVSAVIVNIIVMSKLRELNTKDNETTGGAVGASYHRVQVVLSCRLQKLRHSKRKLILHVFPEIFNNGRKGAILSPPPYTSHRWSAQISYHITDQGQSLTYHILMLYFIL